MKTRAFTLIELLFVIAIIAILASILFPVFAQALAAFSGFPIPIERQVAEGGLVSTHLVSTGVQAGKFQGTPPPPADRKASLASMRIDRFENGKIASAGPSPTWRASSHSFATD